MKSLFFSVIVLLVFQMCATRPQTDEQTCFTGKLVKRGICGQRVVQLVGQPSGGLSIAVSWTDSLANKPYENVFAVGNECDFPSTIKEGEEFNFTMTTQTPGNCIQCKAYTPVPEQRNNILVGCTQAKK